MENVANPHLVQIVDVLFNPMFIWSHAESRCYIIHKDRSNKHSSKVLITVNVTERAHTHAHTHSLSHGRMMKIRAGAAREKVRSQCRKIFTDDVTSERNAAD